jgi:HEAT repeat protein
MRIRIVLVMSAAAALVAGATWWMSRNPSGGSSASTPPQPRPVAAVTEPDPVAPQPTSPADPVVSPPTLDGRYALTYTLDMSGTGGAVAAAMTLKGTLVVAPQRDGTDRWLNAALEDAQLTLNDELRRVTDFPADPKTDLGMAFAAPLEANGRVREVRFMPGQSLAARGPLAAVMQAAQFVRVDPQAASYDLEEWSVNGPLASRWLRRSDTEYTRQWHAVDHVESPNGGAPQPAHSMLGEGTVQLQGNRIEHVTASLAGNARTGAAADKRPHYRSRVELHRVEGPARVAVANPQQLAPLVVDQLDVKLPAEPVLPFAEAAKKVQAVRESLHERSEARRELAHALVAEPARAVAVEAMYRDPGSSPLVKRTAVEALAQSATPEAQAAMARILTDDSVSEPDRVMVAGAAMGVRRVENVLLSDMSRIAYQHTDRVYASKVAMALGGSLSWVAARDPARARPYVLEFVERAEVETRPPAPGERRRMEERSNWMGGLGNLGTPHALPWIVRGLDDKDEHVRAGAAHALRFQDPYSVRERMQRVMHEDRSMHVRLGILHAARYMGPESQKSLVERALTFDESESVRTEAAYVVSAWLPKAPGLRQMLAYALEQEKSEKVRSTLRNFLQPGRIAPPGRLIPTVNPLIPSPADTAGQP